MITINKETISHAGDWQACGGEVRGLVRRLRWRRRSHQVREIVAVVFVALVPLALCFSSSVKSFLTSEIELKVAAAPCGYYADEMRAYYCDKSRSDLPSELWVHLAHCPNCSQDLVFYGGIAQCRPGHRAGPGHSAHAEHDAKQAVGLMRLLAEGTLAVHH
jgi:hypothetical protein